MKIMIFTEGTILGPKNHFSLYSHQNYIPVGCCVEKIRGWESQGAEIRYLTSRKSEKQVAGIQTLLEKYGFPEGRLYYREKRQKYRDIIEEILPDILIEDDCRSIGGKWQWCITQVRSELRAQMKSIVVREFKGIDHLPDGLDDLERYNRIKGENLK